MWLATRLLRVLRRIVREKHSYHDVSVVVDGKTYRVSDNYAYRLQCCRAAGWELWHIWSGKEELLGGEFNNRDFQILVGDKVICAN